MKSGCSSGSILVNFCYKINQPTGGLHSVYALIGRRHKGKIDNHANELLIEYVRWMARLTLLSSLPFLISRITLIATNIRLTILCAHDYLIYNERVDLPRKELCL